MKYKQGERVRIKSLEWYNKNKNIVGDILYKSGPRFASHMKKYCGQTMTIRYVYSDAYKMEEDSSAYESGHFWTDEMIEGLVEEETCTGLNIYKDGYIHGGNVVGNEITLPEGYQFVDENGNVINATKIVLEKKKKEYPKTYEKCCKVLNTTPQGRFQFDFEPYGEELYNLHRLFVCRDAYWKLYGDEIGLGKPWEPDWSNLECDKFCIWVDVGDITLRDVFRCQHILAFPTAEMRDSFYENFKSEIECCKELLQ